MKSISQMWVRARRSAGRLLKDRSGIAATEFAVIVPVMLVMFFGTVEFSAGVAVDRKVTLVARTLSDLTSQGTTATDVTLGNSFAAANAIFYPYPATPTISTITELAVDPTTLKVTVVWSRSATINAAGSVVLTTGHPCSYVPTIPAALVVGGTSLIWSEVSYLYKPAVNYGGLIATAGINLSDVAYTRPRQSGSVTYTTACP
jgi:Flp pilus assembly protein TadG